MGGAGFIGSNLANYLNKNHQVQVFDNLMYGPHQLDNLNDRKIIKGDVANYNDLLDCDKADIIFHLAALSSAPMCSTDPLRAVTVNELGFANVLQFARRMGARVVYASTSSMYNGNHIPWHENQTIQPRTIYEATFHSREVLSWAFYHEYRVPSIGLRFFSVYGKNQVHKKHYGNNLTQFVIDYKANRRPEIYGDGSQSRDLIHVTDVIAAMIKVAEHDDIDCDIFNVGTGISTSFNEIIGILNERFGYINQPNYIENPLSNYVVRTQADISKICTHLKWKPKINLSEGIDMEIRDYA